MTRNESLSCAAWLGLLAISLPAPAADVDATALDRAIDAAVASTESRVVQLRYFGAGDDSLGAAAAPVTGFDAGNGWIVTSTYALKSDPAGVLCRFADGTQEQAEVVARDHGRRLALLSLTAERQRPPPELRGRTPRVGETAIALGRVYSADAVQRFVGIVSAVGRFGGRAVQTDALASPTNYGGPLIGLDGSLLGILTPLSPAGQSGVSLYDSGVGFAVPPSELRRCLSALAAGTDLRPGWLGVSFPKENPLTSSTTLVKVTPEGPADSAGLKPGDRIISLARQPTPSLWRLRTVLGSLDAGQTVTAVVAGLEEPQRAVEIVLGEKPATLPEPPKTELPTKKPDEP